MLLFHGSFSNSSEIWFESLCRSLQKFFPGDGKEILVEETDLRQRVQLRLTITLLHLKEFQGTMDSIRKANLEEGLQAAHRRTRRRVKGPHQLLSKSRLL